MILNLVNKVVNALPRYDNLISRINVSSVNPALNQYLLTVKDRVLIKLNLNFKIRLVENP